MKINVPWMTSIATFWIVFVASLTMFCGTVWTNENAGENAGANESDFENPLVDNIFEETDDANDGLFDLPDDLIIFDDRMMIEGYANKYTDFSREVIVEMIRDDALAPLRMTAAVRVFREHFSRDVVTRDKRIMEKWLIRRMNRSDSAFVKVEIMHTLCHMDRYRYFDAMVPALIQKLDHYNLTLNEIAYQALNSILQDGNNRAREARVVFNTLRRILFLSRRRLANITTPDPKLRQKLTLLRWSIKILGNQELKKLPKEVIGLL
jgi:hypothetical protein